MTVFSINSSSGSLTPVAGSPFPLAATGGYALSPVFDPLGDYLYICDAVFTSSISVYSIDGAIGTVDHSDAFPVANPIYSLAIHPHGGFLYALGSGGISAFQINVGGLIELAGSPFVSNLALSNAHAVISPNGKVLMLADRDSAQFRVLTLNVDGSVGTDVAGSPLSLRGEPLALATTSNGSVAVVTMDPNSVIAVPVDPSSGALGPPGPVATTEQTPFAVTIDSQNKFVYIANQMSDSVSAFALDSTASLTPISGSPYSTGRGPISVITTGYH